MTSNKRVGILRKTLGLTLEQFGKRVGVQKTAISKIERGENRLSDQMRKVICLEFGVREEWLRDGTGEMMERKTRDEEISEAVNRLMAGESAEFKRRLIVALSVLNEDQWMFLAQKLREICGLAEDPEAEDRRKVASYADELKVQRETGGKLSASRIFDEKEV